MLRDIRTFGKILRAITTRDPAARVRRFYEFTDPKTDFEGQRTRYVNIGYWQYPDSTLDEAGAALATCLGDAVALAPEHDVLDVGCGYGEQDFLWLNTDKARSVTGVDVTPRHVLAATQRAEQDGLTDRLTFRMGSATTLPFPDASFDRVVSLDAAFHFHPRSAFFAEAFRVLRPGGLLGTVDTIPLHGDTPREVFRSPRFSLYRFSIPDANWHDRTAYAEQLTRIGFDEVGVRSIREHTWEGWFRHWGDPGRAGKPDWWQDQDQIRRELDLLDCVLAVARKPG
ncbi:SAM-dependent methyltransferase [Crossiella cryophila]|uniref:Erythromycin 3''-O-methyltransferase n=1 Tax=Crossiella cryophila TaxID=43355 RepID=A0A7W7CER8_9PSEU|nr:class I SAM-dependent methyltransferase [Crossiella cryophila]MBB4679814.1 erythromycin 3''-O-methyltransferase [Crossiella cryophila]